MIIALLSLVGLFLVIISFFLLKKQGIFLALLTKDEEKHEKFLRTYGFSFLALGILAFLLAPFAQKESALFFVAVMMLVSGLFSYQFSKKMD